MGKHYIFDFPPKSVRPDTRAFFACNSHTFINFTSKPLLAAYFTERPTRYIAHKMGTISTDEIQTDEIHSAHGSGSITIGSAVFPSSDSTPRSVASFGNTAFFAHKSVYQSVTTATATVDPSTTVLGVSFDGPVQLALPDIPLATQILVVDEGGFCSALKTISATSPSAVGSFVLSTPYSHLRIRTSTDSVSGTVLVSEAREPST